MKKIAIILVLVVALVFCIASVASAQEQEKGQKELYYDEIELLLQRILQLLKLGRYEEADALLKELRTTVYSCARYLAENNEYDGRIILALNYAVKAVEEKDTEQMETLVEQSRELAEAVLLKTTPVEEEDDLTPKHS